MMIIMMVLHQNDDREGKAEEGLLLPYMSKLQITIVPIKDHEWFVCYFRVWSMVRSCLFWFEKLEYILTSAGTRSHTVWKN